MKHLKFIFGSAILIILFGALVVVYQQSKSPEERYQTINIIRQSDRGTYVILDKVSHRLYLVKYADGKGVKSIAIGNID